MVTAGCTRSADISPCGRYRWTLTRRWDERPALLVCMFNPSTADGQVDDPTITLLCHIAAHNGFGGIVVVNGIPLRSPSPVEAAYMANIFGKRHNGEERDRLQENRAVIEREVARAGAVLIAWGALANRCPSWFDSVLEVIWAALPVGSELYCLGYTKGGYPLHPLARGKQKVRKDALLLPWSTCR